MKVEKKNLEKSQVELNIELSLDEFKPFINKAAKRISKEVKIDGFRAGNIPYKILKQKIGEMTILEEAANIAINKTLEQAIRDNVIEQPIGQPQVNITKLAPNNPMEYKVVMALLPEVALGDYKNAKVKQEKTEIKDEEVDKMINQLQEMRVKETIANREIKDGDKVIVDIEMFLDKVPVEGGQGKNTGIVIGQGYIVPGFGKKLIGAKKNDVREFSLPYPKEHHQQNLAGKLVEFKVKIQEIYKRELPEINDEFVKNFGLNNVDQFKENIKKSLLFEKQQKAEQKAELEMLDKIIAKTKFSDIPEILVNSEAQTMMAELEAGVAKHGGKFEDYLNHLKKTKEQITLDMLPDAVKRVKTSLLIREISNTEKIKTEDKEVEQELEKLLKQHKDEKDDIKEKIKSAAYKEYTKNLMNSRKVIEKLKEWNVSK